jgi:hypothetical protein
MKAALITLPHSLGRLEASALALQDAHADYAGAVVAHAEAKRALELARAHRLVQGIEGKNAEQRDAILRLDLMAEHDSVFAADTALTEARCTLDCARLDWELARLTVSSLEATA